MKCILLACMTMLALCGRSLAQQQDPYAVENRLAATFVADMQASGLPLALDWNKVPPSIKLTFAYDVRQHYKGHPPSFENLMPADKAFLSEALKNRLYVEFLRTKPNSYDVGAIAGTPPTMSIGLDRSTLDKLRKVFPYTQSVSAVAREFSSSGPTTSSPLVLSTSGYVRSPGYYTQNPGNADTGPSVRRVIVDPLGFDEVAFLMINPIMIIDDSDGSTKLLDAVRCSGVLLSPKWLLTARHCVGDPENKDRSDSLFQLDSTLAQSVVAQSRGFVLLQKNVSYKDYAVFRPCFDDRTASLTIVPSKDCPYLVGYFEKVAVPDQADCVSSAEHVCEMVRPDVALVRVSWLGDEPASTASAVPLIDTPTNTVSRMKADGGITFAGFGLSLAPGSQSALTALSPLVIGFHGADLAASGEGFLSEYQWTQTLARGTDGLCFGDSGGPIFSGLIRGHRNSAPHRVFALVSRVETGKGRSASQGEELLRCNTGTISVAAIFPWWNWMCSSTGNELPGCIANK